ncbi:SnoaL-like polyketide cyclase [Mucilaginibacter gossypiicola]|uniref:SnoaL-like polyketide cyclase n=1 Tax=Mucilaginibacter gossypiicola TaxID=551995 RepID=A0A1H8LM93_9SPHI|nr:ester cyclase [Mucilaginibacter gossypiicola]SEO06133.1 SnoaL-like polyketide cyclase [Mucilaginibacter gossypiicola]
MKNVFKTAAIVILITTGFIANSQAQTKQEIAKMQSELKSVAAADKLVKEHLNKFDTLDYTVFSNQQWQRFHESHGQNIKVYWPDGHVTKGLAKHIEDMKALFVYAPDTRIKQHPIRFGSGDFTAVTGVFEGTFTKPMPIGGGKFIQPTGKKFSIPMATIGIWKNGVMTEEHLFWDNKTYMDQIMAK